tara:strand:- start:15370 stop:15984 length:615 start_codon:yes stop_codon:yes gene_type:complete
MGFNATVKPNYDYPEGVYVDRVQVTSIENVLRDDDQFGNDINIKIVGTTPDNPNNQYDTVIYLGGKHAKGTNGMAIGWGSKYSKPPVDNYGSRSIAIFLQTLGHNLSENTLNEDSSFLSEECVRDCIGRSIYILQYETTEDNQNGNPKRRTWWNFASESEGKKKLYELWNKSNKPKMYRAKPDEKLANIFADKPIEGVTEIPEV